MVSAQGFEPRTHALEGRCSIQLSYAPTIINLERVKGIEPSQPAWKAGTLPLSYTRIIIGGGWWIRTTESNANRFTVCPLWPLGKSSVFLYGAGDRNRTYNLLITSQLLYRWATPAKFGGDTQIRTGDQGVAVHCLTTWLCRLTYTISILIKT